MFFFNEMIDDYIVYSTIVPYSTGSSPASLPAFAGPCGVGCGRCSVTGGGTGEPVLFNGSAVWSEGRYENERANGASGAHGWSCG